MSALREGMQNFKKKHQNVSNSAEVEKLELWAPICTLPSVISCQRLMDLVSSLPGPFPPSRSQTSAVSSVNVGACTLSHRGSCRSFCSAPHLPLPRVCVSPPEDAGWG